MPQPDQQLASQASLYQGEMGLTAKLSRLQLMLCMQPDTDPQHASEYAAVVVDLTWPACWVLAGQLQAGMQGGGQGLLPASACPAA